MTYKIPFEEHISGMKKRLDRLLDQVEKEPEMRVREILKGIFQLNSEAEQMYRAVENIREYELRFEKAPEGILFGVAPELGTIEKIMYDFGLGRLEYAETRAAQVLCREEEFLEDSADDLNKKIEANDLKAKKFKKTLQIDEGDRYTIIDAIYEKEFLRKALAKMLEADKNLRWRLAKAEEYGYDIYCGFKDEKRYNTIIELVDQEFAKLKVYDAK